MLAGGRVAGQWHECLGPQALSWVQAACGGQVSLSDKPRAPERRVA